MRKEIEFRLTEEHILWLLKGKKINYETSEVSVRIEPPQGYLTMTYEEVEEIKRHAREDANFIMVSKLLATKQGEDILRILGDEVIDNAIASQGRRDKDKIKIKK